MATRKKAAMQDTIKRFNNFLLFEHLPKELADDNITFTATDVEYDDVCDTVTFKVAEAPGWLFGIWYTLKDEPDYMDENKMVKTLKYQVFGQYELFIDKFKPSRSMFCENDWIYDITPDTDFKNIRLAWGLGSMFLYIINEPALAFCRDVHCWDYNYAYHTREEAEEKMAESIAHEAKRETFEIYATETLLNYIKEFWKGEKVFIQDFGTGVSPRYEVTFLYEDEEDDDRPIHDRIHGMHYLSYLESAEDDPSDHPDDIKMYEFFCGYHELKTRLAHESDEYDFCWWPDVSTWFYFQSIASFELWKERVKNESGENIEDSLIYC